MRPRILPQIFTLQNTDNVWHVIYDICNFFLQDPLFKNTKDFFFCKLFLKKKKWTSLAYLS